MLNKTLDHLYTNYFKIKYVLTNNSHRIKYAWNPVYNLVMNIKDDYNKIKKDDSINFEHWLEILNNDKYNKIFNHLEINQDKNLLIIRYEIADVHDSLWKDRRSIFRECRSIVLDISNETIVIAPFKKFFNINEVKETNVDVIKKKIKHAKIFEITDKLDGSMQNARFYNNNILLTGSRSINRNNSWRLEEGYMMLNDNYKKMIKENPHLTFTFEYISLKDAHVVKYKKEQEGQYLIGARNVYTGKQLSYNELCSIAIYYKVKITKIEHKTLEQLFNEMSILKSDKKEGWVLNIDGEYVKVKCDDYANIHRILDKVSSVNVVIKNIADGTYDDLISKVPENHRSDIEIIAKQIFSYISEMENEISKAYKSAPKNDKKEFMLWVDNNCKKSVASYVKAKYLGQKYNLLKKRGNGYKKFNELTIY